ncbi:MAG: TonB-dependent receptor [Ferruginibacter sp.]
MRPSIQIRCLLLLVLLAGGFSAAQAQPCTLSLSGHVEDADTKEKLDAATVLLEGKGSMVLTDARGDFQFHDLCPGTYTLRITHIHCDSLVMTVVLQHDKHVDFLLPHAKNVLQTVTMESKMLIPVDDRNTLTGQTLQETRGLSISEALSKIPGIVLLQTGTNNAKPIIHGLHGNRVITVNNGIRQEGQQWGNEHAPEIDPFIADKLTLVQGVDALRYGSDAIGGVLLIEPRPLRFAQQKSRTELHAGYFTNNQQYVLSGIHERSVRSLPDLSVRIQATLKQGGNAATPNYRLNNTGLHEINGSFTVGYRKNRYSTELYGSRFQTRIGIFTGSHIGNFSDLLQAIQSSQPDATFLGQKTYSIARPRQEVTHTLVKWKQAYRFSKGKIQLLVSGQQNDRKEFDVVRSSSNTKPQMDLTITTMAEDFLWEYPLKKNQTLMLGLNGLQQQNVYSGRYFIPNFTAFSGGIYGLYKWQTKQWEFHAGARMDHRQLATRRLPVNGDTVDNAFRFSTQAATMYIQYKPAFIHDLSWSIQVGWASRSPHVNELLSNGIHHGTATYEQGDPFLRIERSISIQSNLVYENHAHTVRMELGGYWQQIRDFIYLSPQPDSPVLTNAGAFPKMVYRQTDARLAGIDAVVSVHLTRSLTTDWQGSMLRATDRARSTWMILMPADRLKNTWKYSFANGKKFSDTYVSLEAQHVFRQVRIPDISSGIKDYKTPPNAYTLCHAHASTTRKMGAHTVTVGVSVRNLFNTVYRDYLNQFRYFTDELGRNIQIRFTTIF